MGNVTIQPFGESDYNELLRQAVAVIDQARTSLAVHINNTVSNAQSQSAKPQLFHCDRALPSYYYI